jgi:predicted NAD/FAD-binding protein
MRIAIIGTGISGSLAARLLSTEHEVTVFEANDYPGGHANTVDVQVSGEEFHVDTGFMVFNRRTYPNFCRLLEMLEITSQASDMSFSVSCSKTGLEYQGSSLNGLFAQRLNCLRPSFLRMLRDIARFNRVGISAAETNSLRDGQTVRQFLNDHGIGKPFVDQYLVPMAAAIWSSNPRSILDFPVKFMIGFFANHGLMQIRDRPQWRTIIGGSRKYVEVLLQPIRDRVCLNSPVKSVARGSDHVQITTVGGEAALFDEVVFASHADQTLNMLADASSQERDVLRTFPYHHNEAVLHTDTRLLPRSQRAWASWNYHISPGEEVGASVTYDLSRLQNHNSATPILLTLNESQSIDPTQVFRKFTYHHPAYSADSITAQQKFDHISGVRRTHFCGAYWGYGFHEDGVNSSLAVARHFGIGLEACTAASTKVECRTAATGR